MVAASPPAGRPVPGLLLPAATGNGRGGTRGRRGPLLAGGCTGPPRSGEEEATRCRTSTGSRGWGRRRPRRSSGRKRSTHPATSWATRWRCRCGSRAARASGCATRCTATGTATPLHPTLVPVPIGAWTVAAAFDVLDTLDGKSGGRYRDAADLNIAAGCVGAVAAAAARMADWNHTHGKDRRVRAGPRRAQHDVAGALRFVPGAAPPRPPARRQARRRFGLEPPVRRRLPRRPSSTAAASASTRRTGLGAARLHAGRGAARARGGPAAAGRGLGRARPRHGRRGPGPPPRPRARAGCALLAGWAVGEGWVLEGGLVCPWHGSLRPRDRAPD